MCAAGSAVEVYRHPARRLAGCAFAPHAAPVEDSLVTAKKKKRNNRGDEAAQQVAADSADTNAVVEGADTESKWERTPVPFIAAVAVVAAIIAAIVIGGIVSPAEENVSEAQRVDQATIAYIKARNGEDAQLKGAVCPGFDDNAFVVKPGGDKITYSKVENVKVDGDRAKADVTVAADEKDLPVAEWNFVRSDGGWLVCN
jgi:hypothetical protein